MLPFKAQMQLPSFIALVFMVIFKVWLCAGILCHLKQQFLQQPTFLPSYAHTIELLSWKWSILSPWFWAQGHVWDMSLKCPRTFMPKQSVAPKSFEDICPVLSFLEDIIQNLNISQRKILKMNKNYFYSLLSKIYPKMK